MVRRRARFLIGSTVAVGLAAAWWAGASARPAPAEQPPPADEFTTKIVPFVNKFCMPCHNADKAAGGLSLDAFQSTDHAKKDRKTWANVAHALAAGDMPPKKKAQPSKEEKAAVIDWVENALTKVDCGAPKDPGRVTLRRLNRAEYNNTVRDLCGVGVAPADDFPADDVGYGFDNIGDVLSLPPILLEKYLAAADLVLAAALTRPEPPASQKQQYRTQNIRVIPREAKFQEGGRDRIVFKSDGSAFLEKFNFPAEGEYVVRFRGWGSNVGGAFPKAAIRVDGKELKTVSVEAPKDKPEVYEVRAKLPAGERKVAVAFTNPHEDKEAKDAAKKFREFGLQLIEVEGPFNPTPKPDPASVKLLLVATPKGDADKRPTAEKVLGEFARRAFRRPVKPDELARLVKLYDVAVSQGDPWEQALRLPMKAVLCSPHFLFRVEADPADPEGVRPLNDFEYATRLSYFLWSSMPDEELFTLAARNELRKPEVLEAQVKRMLRDPKAKALAENFAGQWLQLRNLKTLAPDAGYYPDWDEALRAGMVREAEAFFGHVVREDRSVLEFLDADYAFVNDRMSRHYKVPRVDGPEFRKVKLPDGRRGGIVTMASTLAVTSNPTRTSPVKRGKWILENILGTPPPPPAPDIPELPPTNQLRGTLRQQMEQHRANPSCATCHSKLDPLGFGLENFDGIGAWRDKDNGQKVDSSGVLPDGAKFDGPAELRKVLVGKADQFRRCFADKLLTYALGRGLEYYDKCALDEVVAASKAGGDRFSAVVLAVVKSDPFGKRKGKRSE
ncbi:MAG: DUF1592 domain-containing protein [Gemmataceae bacterium]|nr:DUF1592 domain-containing protein [Gemmataceae bacterium]